MGRVVQRQKGYAREIIQTLMKLFLLTCVNNSKEKGQMPLLQLSGYCAVRLEAKGQVA